MKVSTPNIGQNFAMAMDAAMTAEMDTVELICQAVAINVVAYLRSLTDEMRPPAGARMRALTTRQSRVTTGEQGPLREGEKRRRVTVGLRQGPVRALHPRMSLGNGRPRRAHPGHWADITGLLALGYTWDVARAGDVVTITWSNGVEYAAKLEQREGFFVLRGILDPGGIVEREMANVAAQIAPGMRVVRT